MAPSGEFKSIQSLLQQVHKEAEGKEIALPEHPPAAGPTEEELRELVAAFRSKVERDARVRRLVQRHKRRGFYAIRPWHWATAAIALVLALTAVPYASVYLSTRARIARTMEAAVEAAREGAHDEALRRLKEAIALGAPAARARASVADAYRVRRNPEEIERAATLYAAAAEDDPADPIYLVRAAEAYLDLRRPAEAERFVRRAEERFPRALDVLLVAGRLAIERRDYAAAEASLRELVNRDPSNIVGRFRLLETYRARGNIDGARREEEFLLAADPRTVEEFEVLVGLADIYIRAGRTEEARRLLQGLADREDVPSRVFRTLARLSIDAADFDAAERYLDEAIRRAPDDAEAYVLRGEVRYVRGDLAAAAADFRTAVEIDPRLPRARYDLGNLLFYDLDDAEGARAEFEAALRLGLDEPALRYNLGAARFLLGDFAGAIEAFGSLPEAYLRHPEVEWALASSRLAAGETETARAALRRSALRRQDPRSYCNYALALEASGETTASLRVLYNAIRLARTPEEADPKVQANLRRFLEGRPLDLGRDLHRAIEKRIALAPRLDEG